ncbi:MAG TPA: GWxTD domain-containing protein [Terriglobales bacterium]|nr:GWxTD domain-containing protein [Terriglobales bacterium]
MNKRLATLAAVLALVPGLLEAAPVQKDKAPAAKPKAKTEQKRRAVDVKSLDQVYQDFLTLTAYIISPKEREVFLELPDNRDRDIFIEDFWKLRDPTPGTPENEYKEDILKRFEHVNKYFRAGRPGWMTDRGRIWMILGEPASYDRFPGTTGIVPCEVWYYYTDGTKSLPTHFGLIFFQKKGFGEPKLYDPFIDGPKALLEPLYSLTTIDQDDYEKIYETIRNFAPTLANIAVSLIPGEFGYNGYQPTPRNTELLASIVQYPYTGLNPTYATHFFDFKGMVSTEYLTNYIENDGLAIVIRDPVLDQSFIHFSVVPQKLSVDYYDPKDQYFCNFKVDVSLRRDETVIFQYTKEFPITFPSAEVERFRQNGIALEDTFPVCEGQYKLDVLVQNSVAKEFTVFERSITIPKATGPPSLGAPLLGYKVKAYPEDVLIPFKTLGRKIIVDPKMTFASGDEIDVLGMVADLTSELWQKGQVEMVVRGLGKSPVVKRYTLRLADSPYHKVATLAPTVAAGELAPDYYELTLRLLDGVGNALDEKSAQFVVTAEKAVGHPIANAKGFSLANRFFLHYQLARQYDKLGLADRAEAEYAQGFSGNPNHKEGLVEYARFLLRVRKYDEALTVVDGLKDVEKGRYDYLLISGLAKMGKGDATAAVNDLLAANRIYNSDTVLLNALGSSFLKLGQRDQALSAFQASLKLNDQQEDIKRIVADLTKK